MAASPVTAEAYTTLMGLFEKSAFDTIEKEVILLAVSKENECGYCLAAHGKVAAMRGVPPAVVAAIRAGSPIADERLQLLVTLVRAIVGTRGWPDRALVERFFALDYTPQHYLEIVLAVSMKTLSNYVNHAADTPLDEAFASDSKAA
ncbi:MAG: carboxymuconolactone decarboxylase family protein [Kiloniellaceae bacterium]